MAKEKKRAKRDPKRFEKKLPEGLKFKSGKTGKLGNAEYCTNLEDACCAKLRKACGTKHFEQVVGKCAGSSSGQNTPVDLIVLIDTSGSMNDEAKDLSLKADQAIQAAAGSCPSDLRVAWFGIEGTWEASDPATKFKTAYRDYLQGLGVAAGDLTGTPGDLEDGAAAVIDLSTHYDWRPGAARAIFYLGDEAMEDGDPQTSADSSATDAAISVANAKGVKVFTYLGTTMSGAGQDPDTIADYRRLASSTGGQFFSAPVDNVGGFQHVLEQIICASGQTGCLVADEPELVPCLRLRWGDGPRDQIETDDLEVLCISVGNAYSNVTFKNFVLSLEIRDQNGQAVAINADGAPSVWIRPDCQIGFGDIPPCDPQHPADQECTSRQVVLKSTSAKAGEYHIFVGYCFEASYSVFGVDRAFTLKLVKS